MGQPLIFGLFKHSTLQFLQQIHVKKCPSSKECWDSNPQPLEHEPPPITTRPGLISCGEILAAHSSDYLLIRMPCAQSIPRSSGKSG